MESPADLLDQHQRNPYGQHDGWWECACGAPHDGQHLVEVLGLEIEGRQLSDGEGGISTNWKTGEITGHGKPCTRQIRWTTAWVKDEEMALPLQAYVQSPF